MQKSQVTLSVRLKSKPGLGNQLKEAALNLINPTRKEEGCIDYYFHIDPQDPDSFMFYENWINQEALDKHANMPYLRDFQSLCTKILAEEPEFKIWKINE